MSRHQKQRLHCVGLTARHPDGVDVVLFWSARFPCLKDAAALLGTWRAPDVLLEWRCRMSTARSVPLRSWRERVTERVKELLSMAFSAASAEVKVVPRGTRYPSENLI